MSRTIGQRELRHDTGEILRAVEAGESFIVTRNGVPLAELIPLKRAFVPRDALVRSRASLAPIDPVRFRVDLDRVLDPSLEPRV